MSKLVTAEQRTDDWYQARLGIATASRFDDIMTGAKYAGWKNYKAQLVLERLTGAPADSYSSRAMEWGTETEELARTMYLLKTGNEVSETGLYIHDTIQAGASPDGLISENGGLEIKCPNTATHIETLRTGHIPRKYRAQVQGQMWIVGLDWVDFVSFDPRLPDQAQLFIERIFRDNEYISELEDKVVTFLEEVEQDVAFIQNYKAPDITVEKQAVTVNKVGK